MDKTVDLLKRCLEMRSPILLLGAGFSLSAKAGNGENLMLGRDLCKKLLTYVISPNINFLSKETQEDAEYFSKKGKLKDLCTIIRENNLLEQRNRLLQESFSKCTYDETESYSYLTTYDWPYIFTLNIDNLVEEIYKKQHKPLTCWKLTSEHYKEVYGQTVLVKLHGDVGDPDTYVFDDEEYQRFSENECWMLRKFSDLYVCHDLIIVGSQFQERDIKIALQKVFKFGCDNSDYHYFFISPGTFNAPVSDALNNRSNFHHIQWTAKQFLDFLNNDISRPKDALQSLCCQGVSFWNQQINDAQRQREDWELYYGKPSEPRDFYYSVDISREEQEEIANFINQNSYGYIEL